MTRARTAFASSVGVLVGCTGIALSIGPTGWHAPWPWTDISALRAPRVLLAGVVGASLSLAGMAMQALLRNDLAEPYVLGLSGGASVAAVASLLLMPGLSPGPAAALGALLAAWLVLSLAGTHEPARLVLFGVALGSALSSVTGLLLMLAPGERLLRTGMFWLFGGVGTPQASALIVPSVCCAASGVWLWARSERLDRITLGDDVATSLGVDIKRARRALLAIAVTLTASAVAVAGLIGFVGLVAPHAARQLVGAPHRAALPMAALLGASLVVISDAIARTALSPREVPLGLITALVGGPFFLWRVRRSQP